MDTVIKCSALALSGAAVCLLLRGKNPELSLLLGALVCVSIALAGFRLGQSLDELTEAVRLIIGTANTGIAPVLKCVAIAAVTKLAGELCKDASQNAAAASLELAGTLCAISVAMPTLVSMLRMIGGIL